MERLRILAAAVALGEFTVAQLAAYAGASQDTVRSVLKRDERFFQRGDAPNLGQPPRQRRPGRPAAQYRVAKPTAIRAMILDLEREIDALPGARQALTSQSGSSPTPAESDFEDRLADVMVAEDALVRAWHADENAVCAVNADTAMRSVLQARPNNNYAWDTSWDRLLTSSEDEALERRILSVYALARITTELGAIGIERLGAIAHHVSLLQAVSPIERVWPLARAIVRMASAGGASHEAIVV